MDLFSGVANLRSFHVEPGTINLEDAKGLAIFNDPVLDRPSPSI